MVLDVAALRERLKRTPPAFSVYGDDDRRESVAAVPTAAAVLVPIVERPSGLTVIFTRRTAHLKAHSGQVSFPGGRAEPEDPTPEFTALREAQEEIGLAAERVEVLARLPDYHTRTGFRVTPVVALVTAPVELVPDPREVEEVFEVPLAFLLDPANHRRETRELQGRSVGYYVMRYGTHTIWGATAGMLVNLYRHLAE
ncbi:MAG TPA: CoA pyrophosphatase [Burkholderiales bacterium]|jgi:8-oxo-dGTP pyrophosphatase MutT (NUDIX family)|nr:CoA pyrophosphatase [Burkholderiales bacterium]